MELFSWFFLSASLNYNDVPCIGECVRRLAFLCLVSCVPQQLSNCGSISPEVWNSAIDFDPDRCIQLIRTDFQNVYQNAIPLCLPVCLSVCPSVLSSLSLLFFFFFFFFFFSSSSSSSSSSSLSFTKYGIPELFRLDSLTQVSCLALLETKLFFSLSFIHTHTHTYIYIYISESDIFSIYYSLIHNQSKY